MTAITIDIQRLRNLTTSKLHTQMGDIYADLEAIYGEKGFMTHMLPNLNRAARPWLQAQSLDPRFYDGKHDPTHTGTVTLPTPTAAERAQMWERYNALPHPFDMRA